jgi:hypothetical protein
MISMTCGPRRETIRFVLPNESFRFRGFRPCRRNKRNGRSVRCAPSPPVNPGFEGRSEATKGSRPCASGAFPRAGARKVRTRATKTHIFALTTGAGHGSPNSRRRFSAPRRIKLDAAQFVENDDQNAPPAEKRDERLTAPLLRLLPGGRRDHEARAPGP